jgi:hypothetical protein
METAEHGENPEVARLVQSAWASLPAPSPGAVAGAGEGERDPLLVGGGIVVAAISATLIALIAYKTFYAHTVSANSGIFFLGLAFFPYTGGVYMFCYAWKRGDVAGALRLTLIVAIASAAALALFAVVLALLSRSKDAATAAAKGEGARDWTETGLGNVFEAGRGIPADILMGTFGVAQTQRAAEPALRVVCERCGQTYTPVPPRAACPSCGWEALAAQDPAARAS